MIKNVSFETQRVCERARVAAQLLPLRELRRLLGASSRSQLVAAREVCCAEQDQ
jgi:hypothetical protein